MNSQLAKPCTAHHRFCRVESESESKNQSKKTWFSFDEEEKEEFAVCLCVIYQHQATVVGVDESGSYIFRFCCRRSPSFF